jgi:hypothetical protein
MNKVICNERFNNTKIISRLLFPEVIRKGWHIPSDEDGYR